MATYFYTQTVVYTLEIQAASEEEADSIAQATAVTAPGVTADYEGWQEDGVEESFG